MELKTKTVQSSKEKPKEPIQKRPLWTLASFDEPTSISKQVQSYVGGSVNAKYEYHSMEATSKGRVSRTFLSDLPDLNGGLILDAGCSLGLTTLELAGLYPESRIVGVDIDSRRLQAAETNNAQLLEKGRVGLLLGDAYCLRAVFDSSVRFDAIFFMNNLLFASEWMGSAALSNILSQTRLFLKDGGYLLVSADRTYSIMKNDGSEFVPVTMKKEDNHFFPSKTADLLDDFNSALDFVKYARPVHALSHSQ